MTDSFVKKRNTGWQQNKPPDQDADPLTQLRHLISEPVEIRVARLEHRFDTSEIQPEEISRILPEAIKHRATLDDKVGKALESSIESAISTSINRDRDKLANALFPVLGPAIRKSILSTIQGMFQSFNQILEHTFSIQGLKWRLDAFRTKRPFAEIVLLNTLLYQVEQVFLIHRETGLLLSHAVSKEIRAQDPDLVSGMLTAIQDFVFDSFGTEKNEDLDVIRMGADHSLWIERGAYAFLAIIIRGTPPLDLRSDCRDTIEDIHFQHRDSLESFSGDNTRFESVTPHLESLLQFQAKSTQSKISPLTWATVAVVIFLIGLISFISARENLRWSRFLSIMKYTQGYVITKTEKQAGQRHVYGLKDPDATAAGPLLKNAGLEHDSVVFHLEPYHSLHPEFLRKRLKKALDPPETVGLELKEGHLYARGAAIHSWIIETRKLVRLIPGINTYHDSGLTNIDMELSPPETVTLSLTDNTLHAVGMAPDTWISDAVIRVKQLPGMLHFNTDKLINMDKKRVASICSTIESTTILFNFRSVDLTRSAKEQLRDLHTAIRSLILAAKSLNQKATLTIIGHTGSLGTDQVNTVISSKRAEIVYRFFISEGFSTDLFNVIGVGTTDPVKKELSERDRALNRSVTFKVTVPDVYP